MTKREAKIPIGSKRQGSLQEAGETNTIKKTWLTLPFKEPSSPAFLKNFNVNLVVMKEQLLIMKTMTNSLMLSGSVSRATKIVTNV